MAEREILRLVDKYGVDTVADRVRRGAGLRRAAHPPARRRAARRHLGDRGLHRLRPRRGRGPGPDQGQADDRGRPAPLRPHRLAPGGRDVPQRRLRHRRSRASSPARRRSSRTCRSTPASTASSRSTSGPRARSSTRRWPIAVTGFCSGAYEKIMNAIFELWSQVMPERAIACSFNLEYLLVGGRDARRDEPPDLHVVRLDGRRLGRPQRQGRLELHARRSSASGSRSSRSRARSG